MRRYRVFRSTELVSGLRCEFRKVRYQAAMLTGADSSGRLFAQLILRLHQGIPVPNPKLPTAVQVRLCRQSGLRPACRSRLRARRTFGACGPKAAKAADGKLSCLNAAAKVLADKKEPVTTKEMIEVMAAKGSSPNGQTPAATLYSAILRQINTKGKESRFKNTDRGHFTLGYPPP